MYRERRFLLECLFTGILIGCLGLPAWAQSGRKPQGQPGQPGQPGQQTEKPVIRLETREVVIPLRAYNAEGNYVDDLTAKDVLVLEEDEARPVTSVKREPANIVLILDLSNEVGTFKNGPSTYRGQPEEEPKRDKDLPVWKKPYEIVTRPTLREFADNFVSRFSPEDQLAIIQYSDKVQLIQDWTNDRSEALNALRSKYRIGLKSRYYDALLLATQKLRERAVGRRIIVLVSDGIDTASRITQSQALTAIQRAQATVFVIGWAQSLHEEVAAALDQIQRDRKPGVEILGSTNKRIAELQHYLKSLDGAAVELRGLADSSGGEMWLPETHGEIISSPKMLMREIGAQYSLAFLTERRPSLDDTHSILVLPARRGLSVRSRSSYYTGDEERPSSR